jgi:hypothetical protein
MQQLEGEFAIQSNGLGVDTMSLADRKVFYILDVPIMDWNRTLSGLLALIYLILAFFAGGPEAGLKVLAFLILPLACIWFADHMGRYTGKLPITGGGINQQTPGCLVCIGGWLLLLLPIFVGIVFFVFN